MTTASMMVSERGVLREVRLVDARGGKRSIDWPVTGERLPQLRGSWISIGRRFALCAEDEVVAVPAGGSS